MANTYQTVKDKIITKLQAITTLQEIRTQKNFNFSGFPAAFVIPAEGSGDYETNVEDERIYAFECHVFYQYDQEETAVEDALDNLYDVCDDILDSFAEDKLLSGITMPTGKMIIGVQPVFAGWVQIPEKELLQAIIQIKVHVSVDNS